MYNTHRTMSERSRYRLFDRAFKHHRCQQLPLPLVSLLLNLAKRESCWKRIQNNPNTSSLRSLVILEYERNLPKPWEPQACENLTKLIMSPKRETAAWQSNPDSQSLSRGRNLSALLILCGKSPWTLSLSHLPHYMDEIIMGQKE